MELEEKVENKNFDEVEKKLEILPKIKSCGTSTNSIENPGTSKSQNFDSKNRGDFEPKQVLPSLQENSLPFEELKHFELPEEADFDQFPELENYESWCGIPPEFEEMLKPEELNLDDMLFRNHPNGESSDDDEDPEGFYQKNLGKEYRKYIRNLISKK